MVGRVRASRRTGVVALCLLAVALAAVAVYVQDDQSGPGHTATPLATYRPAATSTAASPAGVTTGPDTTQASALGAAASATGRRPDGRVAARTPGALNPEVRQETIGATICVSGWTKTVRPPLSFTSGLKVHQLASGYVYGEDTSVRDYEEDHLIPLELGGAPAEEANLWPEPHRSIDPAAGSEAKDAEEDQLKASVCSRAMTLAAAQARILADW